MPVGYYIIFVISTNNQDKHTLDPIWLIHTCMHIYTWNKYHCLVWAINSFVALSGEYESKLKTDRFEHNWDISYRANSITVNPESTVAGHYGHKWTYISCVWICKINIDILQL